MIRHEHCCTEHVCTGRGQLIKRVLWPASQKQHTLKTVLHLACGVTFFLYTIHAFATLKNFDMNVSYPRTSAEKKKSGQRQRLCPHRTSIVELEWLPTMRQPPTETLVVVAMTSWDGEPAVPFQICRSLDAPDK